MEDRIMRDKLNRNEFFEWKKERVKELAKTGKKVAEIASELDMSEDDMYSFLSRNFGGIRRLREAELKEEADAKAVIEFRQAARAVKADAPVLRQNGNNTVAEIREKIKEQENLILQRYKEALDHDKDALLQEFRQQFEADRDRLFAELRTQLNDERTRIISEFRDTVLQEIAQMSEGLAEGLR